MAQRRGVVCLRACAPVGGGRCNFLAAPGTCARPPASELVPPRVLRERASVDACPAARGRAGPGFVWWLVRQATMVNARAISNSHRGPSFRPKKHDSRYSRVSVGAASAYDMMVAYAGRHAPSTDGDATYVSFVCPREGEHGTSAVGAGCGRGLRAPTDSASLRPPKVHTHSLCRNRSRSRRKPRPAAATTAAGTSEGEGRRRRPRRRVQVSCTEPSRT